MSARYFQTILSPAPKGPHPGENAGRSRHFSLTPELLWAPERGCPEWSMHSLADAVNSPQCHLSEDMKTPPWPRHARSSLPGSPKAERNGRWWSHSLVSVIIATKSFTSKWFKQANPPQLKIHIPASTLPLWGLSSNSYLLQ